MALAKVHGQFQIKPNTIDIGRLNSDFLKSINWSINGSSLTKATITTIPDPVNEEDVANKRYVDAKVISGSIGVLFHDKKIIGNGITGVIDGINDTFTLEVNPIVNSEMVFINGILYDPGVDKDYVLTNNTIVFNADSIPQLGDRLLINYRSVP
jgi:hypothetical protein